MDLKNLNLKNILNENLNLKNLEKLKIGYKFLGNKKVDTDNLLLEELKTLIISDFREYKTKFDKKNYNLTDLFIFINNFFLITNIDTYKKINIGVGNIGKFIYFSKILGKGAEGTAFSVNIIIDDIISPPFALKSSRENINKPTEFLREFLNYYAMNYLISQTPNLVGGLGLFNCHSTNSLLAILEKELSKGGKRVSLDHFCGCLGKSCSHKNYLLTPIIKGKTVEKIKFDELSASDIKNILLQICLTLKILQNEYGFVHGDLNDRNIMIEKLDNSIELQYILKDNFFKQKINFRTNYLVRIFDFGAGKINKFDILSKKNRYLSKLYQKKFVTVTSEELKDAVSKYIETTDQTIKNNSLKIMFKNEYEFLSNIIDDKEQILNDYLPNYQGVGEVLAKSPEKLKNHFLKTDNFDELSDILNILNKINRSVTKKPIKEKLSELISLKSLDEIILSLSEDIFSEDEKAVFKINKFLRDFEYNQIKPYKDYVKGIDIDGYDEGKLGLTIFSIENLLNEYDFFNTYSTNKQNCYNKKGKKMENFVWGNPGKSYKFKFNTEPVFYEDYKLKNLPRPNTGMNSFTWSIIYDKIEKKIKFNFGRIFNFTEVGAKHTTISLNNEILVSGELAIVKENGDYFYYINNNSSKMIPEFFHTKDSKTSDFNNFYYMMVIYISLELFKLNNPDLREKIYPSKNLIIKYGPDFEVRNGGDKLINYYFDNQKKCPDNDFIEKYNKFGKENQLQKTCMYFEKDSNKCKHINDLEIRYKKKYLKYKKKYINLCKTIL